METCSSLHFMHRRTLLSGLLTCTLVPLARADEQPWQARLLKGGFDGQTWWSGLAISLAPGWKTYWLVPGDGGIAPDVKVTGNNLYEARVQYPLPARFEDEAGMTIGYKQDVVFPIQISPKQFDQPVEVSLSAFLGVCDVVCIPAAFKDVATFDPARSEAPDQALISRWHTARPMPQPMEGPIIRALAEMEDSKPVLHLELSESVSDIFVEGTAKQYFGKPRLMRGSAILPVSGIKSLDELRGSSLRITVDQKGRGYTLVLTVL